MVWDRRVFPGRWCSHVSLFPFPIYCVEFCPHAKTCFLKSEPILVEAVAAPVNSARPSSVCIWLGNFFSEELESWFSMGSHAHRRGDCGSLMPPCSEELCGAAKTQETGRRSDLSKQELHRLLQTVGDSVSVCSLLVQCSFWSWEHKPTSVISILSVWGEGQRGQKGYKLCIFLGTFKKYI